MEQKIKKEIEEIMDEMNCPKDFICYKSGFENLCKAEDVGRKSVLLCLEENPLDCKFSIPIGSTYYCQCPLRIYIAKKVEKGTTSHSTTVI